MLDLADGTVEAEADSSLSDLSPSEFDLAKLDLDQKFWPHLKQILKITDSLAAQKFLFPAIKDMNSPLRIKNMELGAPILADAISQKNKIAIYADYDVDGTCAGSLLYRFLRLCGQNAENITIFQNDRIADGYGLIPKNIAKIKNLGFQLIVSVDLGITGAAAAEEADRLNIPLIITDHHLPDPGLYPSLATAVINPNQIGDDSGLGYLCGTGVAYYLCVATRSFLRQQNYFAQERLPEPNLMSLLDLYALGTIGDMVPLVGDNRRLVKLGLKVLTGQPSLGVQNLLEACDILPLSRQISSQNISFKVTPKINAAGRLNQVSKATQLLVSENLDQALARCKSLIALNKLRTGHQNASMEVAQVMLASLQSKPPGSAVVLAHEDFYEGVIGIIAAKVMNASQRPTAIIALNSESDEVRGSVRCPKSYHVTELLQSCSAFLNHFGGHEFAGGFSINKNRVEEFTEAFMSASSQMISKTFTAEQLVQSDLLAQSQDVEFNWPGYIYLHWTDVDARLLSELEKLEPFGTGNPEPLFVGKQWPVVRIQILSQRHTKLVLGDSKNWVEAYCWDQLFEPIKDQKSTVDILFTISSQMFRGQEQIQLQIKKINFKS